jgi:menaquinone-9 beta-reductase
LGVQSAEWLADSVAGALGDATALDRGLSRDRTRHRRGLAGYEFLIADVATARPFNLIGRLMFSVLSPVISPMPATKSWA